MIFGLNKESIWVHFQSKMVNCLTKDPTTNKSFEYLPSGKKFKKIMIHIKSLSI